MTEQHPISVPQELVQEWASESLATQSLCNRAAQWGADQQLKLDAEQIAQAYQTGADQELKACCEWLDFYAASSEARDLRTARRPKPPSLKEQAYAALDTYIYGNPDHRDKQNTYNTIRKALEQLND
jgi:hypothetical protein